MGAVRVQTQTCEIPWRYVNLSTEECVKGLLKYRTTFMDQIIYKNNTATMLKENNYEILTLYVWLDDMIKRCKFRKTEKKLLLKYYLEGYSEKDTCEYYGWTISKFVITLKSIVKKIMYQVRTNYLMDFLYWNYVPIKLKRCNTCGMSFPATSDYYHIDNSTSSGWAKSCKSCRSRKNWPDKFA